jgi:transcriptional regulator with XRE-family HTH domain
MEGRIDPPEEIGLRLRALRVAAGYGDRNQHEFAAYCDIAPQTWNNYELGKRTPAREEVAKIRHATQVTMDYVYFGDMKGVPLDLAAKVRAALEKLRLQRSA